LVLCNILILSLDHQQYISRC